MATTKTMAATNGRRDHELTKMLEDRRRQLVYEVQGKIRDGCRDYTKAHGVLDEGESSEVDIQEEIEFALIQMKTETLKRIDARSAESGKAPMVSVLSAARRSPKRASEPFRLPCGAGIVKKLVRRPSCVSA
jgi:capsule polysaccharide export protein KpsE/RkpR